MNQENSISGQKPKKWWTLLYVQVLAAILIGIAVGFLFPESADSLKPLGDGFIRLVKMLIAPVIFVTVTLGIVGAEDLKKVGKTGGLALVYFEVMSTLALILGLVVIEVVGPGRGMNISAESLVGQADRIAAYTKPGSMGTVTDFVMNIIPSQIFDAFARGDILQVLFLALVTGFAMNLGGVRETVFYDWLYHASTVIFRMVSILMRAAPVGAFGAMAFTIGKYGIGSLLALGWLMLTFYATCLIFILLFLGLVAWLHGFSIFRFIAYIKEEIFVVLGASSSEAALPSLMTKLERAGVEKTTVGLVVPAGYSFNLDGTNIYLTMAALFIAQATNTHLSWEDELKLFLVLLLTSKGAAGVAGSGFVVLASTLAVVPSIPLMGITLILGIDRFMSEARAITNFIGNGVATLVVAKWCGTLDGERLGRTLPKK